MKNYVKLYEDEMQTMLPIFTEDDSSVSSSIMFNLEFGKYI